MRKGDTDVSNRPKCSNFAPATFGGHWRDWHRGHGCNLDPTPQSQPVVSPPPTPDVERLVNEMLNIYGVEFTDAHSREVTVASWASQFRAALQVVGDTPTPGGEQPR